MIWRVTPKVGGRGEHRKLVDNVQYAHWSALWQQRPPGAGRYRLEFRDARRQIAKVEYVNVQSPQMGGHVIPTKGRYRPSKRTVPPPVAAWDPSTPNLEQREEAARQEALRRRKAPSAPATPPQSTARSYPPLTPPGPLAQGMFWRLRQNGTWEAIPGERGRGLANYVLLYLPRGEYIFVYSPEKKWPGYILRKTQDGTECLFSQR